MFRGNVKTLVKSAGDPGVAPLTRVPALRKLKQDYKVRLDLVSHQEEAEDLGCSSTVYCRMLAWHTPNSRFSPQNHTH